MELKIAGTVNDSIVDGPGIRFTIFTQGCPHHCEGCHNLHTHDFNGGTIIDTDELLEKIRSNPLLDGVTSSGGEPFCQAEALAHLGKQIRAMGLNVITYTGYTFEKLWAERETNHWNDLLEVTDFLIDGPFILAQKDWNIRFRGSSNQRYLDCQESLRTGTAIKCEP